MTGALLSAFEQAIDADVWEVVTKRMERWRTRSLTIEPTDACQFCGKALSLPDLESGPGEAEPLVLAHLLSLDLGGPHSKENLLPSCGECAKKAKDVDWLAWKGKAKSQAPTLAALRLKVLALSENHLLRTPDEARTKPYLVKKLQQRWQHPRFVVRACLTEEGGLLAFPQRIPMPEGIALLVRLNGGEPMAGAPRVFSIPAGRFIDLIWQLIGQNAWVRRVELPAFPDPMPMDDGPSRWHETYPSVGDILRRRAKRFPEKYPRPWHEKPMDPRTRLHLAALVALRSGQPLDQEWLARHRQEDEHFITEDRRHRDQNWLRHR